jgi:hypothetical protein
MTVDFVLESSAFTISCRVPKKMSPAMAAASLTPWPLAENTASERFPTPT